MLEEHEVQSVLMTMILCAMDGPGSMYASAEGQIEAVRPMVERSWADLLENKAFRPSFRGSEIGWIWQSAVKYVCDLCELTGLLDGEHVVEPQGWFSANVFFPLMLAGAYEVGTLVEKDGKIVGYYRQLSRIRTQIRQMNVFNRTWQALMNSLPRGFVQWAPRRPPEEDANLPTMDGDTLPIDQHKDRILKHMHAHRVTCIQGETGCGKSTRVPMFIYEDWAARGDPNVPLKIIVTQPRRIACITLAKRVQTLMKTMHNAGNAVGYQISGDGSVTSRTKIIFVTTGYLLQVVVNMPDRLKEYTHIVLDEVHERDVDSDLLNLVIKLQMKHCNFNLTCMSATLESDLFSRYFVDHIKHKKIQSIFVGVKRFPVEFVYLEDIMRLYGDPPEDDPDWTPFSNNDSWCINSASRTFNSATTGVHGNWHSSEHGGAEAERIANGLEAPSEEEEEEESSDEDDSDEDDEEDKAYIPGGDR